MLGVEDFGRDISPTGKDQLERTEHNLALRCLRNVTYGTHIHRASDIGRLSRSREHNDRDRRTAFTEFGENRKSVTIRKRQIKCYQIKVGILLYKLSCLRIIGCFKH